MIFPGNDDAISFNDDSSPDTRRTGAEKVYVNGQVNRDHSLDWYYKTIALFPDIPGELKSSWIVSKFTNLPRGMRDAIWLGLCRVRIHIVDPRPYRREIENTLCDAWGRADALDTLKEMKAGGSFYAGRILSMLQEMTADSILQGSAAMRLQSLGRALANPFSSLELDDATPFGAEPMADKPLVAAEDFGKKPGVVRDVTSWSAKSSAAFHSALDALHQSPDENDAVTYRYDFGRSMRRKMVKELLPVHAFDNGNEKQTRILERTRRSMIAELGTHDHYLFGLFVKPGFVELESSESFYVQAADLAAGIASDIYLSDGLAGVVLCFEYVTYNGRRLSLADAEQEMEKHAARLKFRGTRE